MNIFKTLASGSGSINEPNVSAFLGYLLNPKEDHGLGDIFLKKFLEPLLVQNDNLDFMRKRNLSIRSNFEIEVLLEQAFNKERNDIVDIVILCYEKVSRQSSFLAENIIEQKKNGIDNPSHIFLIENKINVGALNKEKKQLEEQYRKTINKLEDLHIKNPKSLVSVIFVTPKEDVFDKVFENFNKDTENNKCHLYWHKKDKDANSINNNEPISEIIREIIKEESQPIEAYCKHTLWAFLEFIESGFKSTIKEELEEKKIDTAKYYFVDGKGNEDRGNNGKGFGRGRLVYAIVKNYIKQNPQLSFEDLQKKFPDKLQGKRCVIKTLEDANAAYDCAKFKAAHGESYDYYFRGPDDIIKLSNNEKTEIVVSYDWEIAKFNNFLEHCKNNLTPYKFNWGKI